MRALPAVLLTIALLRNKTLEVLPIIALYLYYLHTYDCTLILLSLNAEVTQHNTGIYSKYKFQILHFEKCC